MHLKVNKCAHNHIYSPQGEVRAGLSAQPAQATCVPRNMAESSIEIELEKTTHLLLELHERNDPTRENIVLELAKLSIEDKFQGVWPDLIQTGLHKVCIRIVLEEGLYFTGPEERDLKVGRCLLLCLCRVSYNAFAEVLHRLAILPSDASLRVDFGFADLETA